MNEYTVERVARQCCGCSDCAKALHGSGYFGHNGPCLADRIATDISAEGARRERERVRALVEAMVPACPKRKLHEAYSGSANHELALAARMCTPDKPCKDCGKWSALLAAITEGET